MKTLARLREAASRALRLDRRGPARKFVDRAVALAGADGAPPVFATPFLSIVVPAYDAPTRYLDELVASVRAQAKGAWELILSDDASSSAATRAWLDARASEPDLRILRAERNGGIASALSAGIAAATAPWTTFVDHDDALAPHALDRIARALSANPDCQFLFTDEVVTDADLAPVDLFLKPAFDPVLLSGVNYVNHLSVFRTDRLKSLGGVRLGLDGSQDYDLLLRYCAGLAPRQTLHLPYPAYLWRRDGRSYSVANAGKATAAARRALLEAWRPSGATEVTAAQGDLHRVRFDGAEVRWPKVSVIVPNKDAFELVSRTLDGVMTKTDYPDIEVVVVDNGSRDQRTLDLYRRLEAGRTPFRAIVEDGPFDFAAAINRGVAAADGEILLLLNNDIEIPDAGWLKEMASCFAYPDVGVVGAKLLYPDRTIQHAGVMVGFGGLAGHWYLNRPADFPGPMGRLRVRQSMSAVTGACMAISRAAWERVGPLDEARFKIAYNDVDFCLRAREAGFRVVWSPFATLVHHESASRGSDETPQNVERFRREQDALRERHRTDRFEDPAINPWYTKDRSEPEWATLPRLPDPR
ncbi:MAG: glycosyltransferase [Hyphomicrobiales bacterium]|nr:glycosyltransferase [Hyphomicrobiales bacterium]MDE2018490.1 glycosyltransferase [Hyphomicrobiales bacterium]